ncbi:MAG: hypothetical protein AAFU79_22735 [Myxococcota bacterium]
MTTRISSQETSRRPPAGAVDDSPPRPSTPGDEGPATSDRTPDRLEAEAPGARWGAFSGGSPLLAQLPGGFQLPEINLPNPIEAGQEALENTVNGGFEQFRDYLQGPILVSEDLEVASGLPAGRTPVNGQPGIDGAGDALKHVTHAALIQFAAPRVAPSLLQGKEHYQGGDAAVMDRHNNNVGFRIGREAREAVGRGDITRAEAPDFIINRVIQEFEAAQSLGANGDINGGNGPYWLQNYGFSTLDQAAPGWQDRSRAVISENRERALETNFPWDNVELPW